MIRRFLAERAHSTVISDAVLGPVDRSAEPVPTGMTRDALTDWARTNLNVNRAPGRPLGGHAALGSVLEHAVCDDLFVPVMRALDEAVARSNHVALVGPSGSGKSFVLGQWVDSRHGRRGVAGPPVIRFCAQGLARTLREVISSASLSARRGLSRGADLAGADVVVFDAIDRVADHAEALSTMLELDGAPVVMSLTAEPGDPLVDTLRSRGVEVLVMPHLDTKRRTRLLRALTGQHGVDPHAGWLHALANAAGLMTPLAVAAALGQATRALGTLKVSPKKITDRWVSAHLGHDTATTVLRDLDDRLAPGSGPVLWALTRMIRFSRGGVPRSMVRPTLHGLLDPYGQRCAALDADIEVALDLLWPYLSCHSFIRFDHAAGQAAALLATANEAPAGGLPVPLASEPDWEAALARACALHDGLDVPARRYGLTEQLKHAEAALSPALACRLAANTRALSRRAAISYVDAGEALARAGRLTDTDSLKGGEPAARALSRFLRSGRSGLAAAVWCSATGFQDRLDPTRHSGADEPLVRLSPPLGGSVDALAALTGSPSRVLAAIGDRLVLLCGRTARPLGVQPGPRGVRSVVAFGPGVLIQTQSQLYYWSLVTSEPRLLVDSGLENLRCFPAERLATVVVRGPTDYRVYSLSLEQGWGRIGRRWSIPAHRVDRTFILRPDRVAAQPYAGSSQKPRFLQLFGPTGQRSSNGSGLPLGLLSPRSGEDRVGVALPISRFLVVAGERRGVLAWEWETGRRDGVSARGPQVTALAEWPTRGSLAMGDRTGKLRCRVLGASGTTQVLDQVAAPIDFMLADITRPEPVIAFVTADARLHARTRAARLFSLPLPDRVTAMALTGLGPVVGTGEYVATVPLGQRRETARGYFLCNRRPTVATWHPALPLLLVGTEGGGVLLFEVGSRGRLETPSRVADVAGSVRSVAWDLAGHAARIRAQRCAVINVFAPPKADVWLAERCVSPCGRFRIQLVGHAVCTVSPRKQ